MSAAQIRVRSWLVAGCVLLLAGCFSIGWAALWYARVTPVYWQVPDGQAVEFRGNAYVVQSMTATSTLAGRFEDEVAPPGTQYVVVRFVVSRRSADFFPTCDPKLIEVDGNVWEPVGFISRPEFLTCPDKVGDTKLVEEIYLVPTDKVARIAGLELDAGTTLDKTPVLTVPRQP